MGIGRVLGAVAPIAAGYFGGPALAGAFGSATGGAIAAGALTGAGIAALSNQDILGGAVTGGLGGMTGGGLNTAVSKASLSPGMTTGQLNKELISPYTQSGGSLAGKGVGQASTMTAADATSGLATGGGYNPATGSFGASPVSNIAYTGQTSAMEPIQNALSRSTVTPGISDVAREFGGGSEAMGYGKMGLAGLGVAGGAGAFDPEPIKLSDSRDKYDPNARLDLSMDTGIDEALRRDTGLRLIAQGGHIKKYQTGGIAGLGQPMAPPPEYGIIDVGGKFVKTSDTPGPGLISNSEYKEQYGKTTAQQNQQGGGGGGMDPNLAPGGQGGQDGSLNPGAISALASGFAQQQMNPPTKSQTLGLEALAGGGYLETGGEVGDGMSDEIEATIEGEQEARLSDGEFVVPADVVSHLGNGSSDAGAKRLYEMMDKIRMARTGTKKQGKEINPERYMPA
jgi:hypothetical protein